MDKIIFDSSIPSGKSDALGYVTTEDSDGDGKLDKLHIVVPNVDRHLSGIKLEDLNSKDPDKLYAILAPFVEIIAHEMGHLDDYKKDSEQPFPGGESKADAAAKQVLNQMSVKATNTKDKNIFLRSSSMKKQVLEKLVKLANDLDAKKSFDLSDEVMDIAAKLAQVGGVSEVVSQPDPKLDMPYDTALEQRFDAVGQAHKGIGQTILEPNPKLDMPHDTVVEQRYEAIKDAHKGPTGSVKFDWGTYIGKHKGEKYLFSKGHSALGAVQRKGDPCTYQDLGAGKLKIISCPASLAKSLGSVINDFRQKEVTTEKKVPSLAVPSDYMTLDISALEKDLLRLSQNRFALAGQLNKALNQIGYIPAEEASRIVNLSASNEYVNEQIKDALNSKVDERIKNIMDNYFKVSDEFKKAKQAWDARKTENNLEDKMALDADSDRLVKDASFNAIFWTPNTKVVFGRD
jgi:hypothetical protein